MTRSLTVAIVDDEASVRKAIMNENLSEAVSTMWEAEADIILVTRHPDSQRADDLVGVVTRTALTRVFKMDEDLS